MAKRHIPYSIVDVFTKAPFLGNPVAVVRNATDLNDREMQSIAVEFGFSESTFILPPNNESYAARVRIFTPLEEIPFAGHPNIGTAFTIATQETAADDLNKDEFVFSELGGDVAVRMVYEDGSPTGARIVAPQELEVLGECDTQLMAQCLGLRSDQISLDRVNPCVATVGLPFAFVGVRDLDALSSIKTSTRYFERASKAGIETVDGFAICAYTVLEENSDELILRSRVVSPLGVPLEDPATGSASGALGALLAPKDRSVDFRISIEQGVEMGRPSQILVEMKVDSNRPEIVGNCVTVSNGTIYL